ncbi:MULTISPECIES: thioesterase family protein [Devosia]|uniref:1,4-dihydroxy-2-naphthoyl-CoA hydrolase n=1 Tax=Devosia equisanguinis TaxID=2490941 RepID=A0A447IC65_9HYPH|nr:MULTISPECIES: thioesterase family protein [Devosia]ODT47201.1 MAG: 4-hydroxybenzoyl-CoA thioesterase [Pelagibacterium sp. SCN 63-126]ODU89016.1 MAG: 4-hydroxybenzoyl-CoA thioesterase [Pelagibacterium sp. SCN 63-17]OJX43087.1 MAG: 4-hydroxybenzoyl-CoA thioesterase [Devosia sp. 63-57]VDS05062.1 1,4-dihydroxy-2-naphthoyl-CoA hydrolase [Devosia equisanguinis]
MAFTISKPLRFGDCDLTGIAYHPAYLSMLVDVNEAMFASFGVTWKELMFERKMGLPTVTMHIEFKRPATYGDVLDFAVHVRKVGGASLDLETIVSVGEHVIWTIQQRIVATSLTDHKSTRWPDDVRAGLSRYLEPTP